MRTEIGQPVPRSEDPGLLRGEGRYTDDVNEPNQAYAYIVRSSHAHGVLKKIDVEAAKVRLVKVPRDMTVEQFNKQYPSSIDVTQVAVINGLDGASASLKSGQLAKRVVGGVR